MAPFPQYSACSTDRPFQQELLSRVSCNDYAGVLLTFVQWISEADRLSNFERAALCMHICSEELLEGQGSKDLFIMGL